jgi:hypothetical protein
MLGDDPFYQACRDALDEEPDDLYPLGSFYVDEFGWALRVPEGWSLSKVHRVAGGFRGEAILAEMTGEGAASASYAIITTDPSVDLASLEVWTSFAKSNTQFVPGTPVSYQLRGGIPAVCIPFDNPDTWHLCGVLFGERAGNYISLMHIEAHAMDSDALKGILEGLQF